MPVLPRLVLAVAIVGLSACQPPADQSAGAADAVRAADSAWLSAFRSRDVAAATAFMDPAGSIFAPNAPAATGPQAVQSLFEGFYELPGLDLRWQATQVEAARSGELAYSSGTYEMTFNDPAGNPVSDRGKYVTLWRKQPDGSWKVVLDVFNSDLPMPGTGPN